MSAFARATAVESLGDGAWRATCEPSWNTQLGPNGGYLAAVVPRAMTAELDVEMRPTIGAPLYAGAPESTSGGWLRLADPEPLDARALEEDGEL